MASAARNFRSISARTAAAAGPSPAGSEGNAGPLVGTGARRAAGVGVPAAPCDVNGLCLGAGD